MLFNPFTHKSADRWKMDARMMKRDVGCPKQTEERGSSAQEDSYALFYFVFSGVIYMLRGTYKWHYSFKLATNMLIEKIVLVFKLDSWISSMQRLAAAGDAGELMTQSRLCLWKPSFYQKKCENVLPKTEEKTKEHKHIEAAL